MTQESGHVKPSVGVTQSGDKSEMTTVVHWDAKQQMELKKSVPVKTLNFFISVACPKYEPPRGKPTMWFPTRFDTNRLVQAQKELEA